MRIFRTIWTTVNSVSLLCALLPALSAAGAPQMVTVTVAAKPSNTVAPRAAFGAALDGYEKGDVAKIYTPANIKAINTAGFGEISYRLRTELGVEAWHWNPQGTWSAGHSGYWTSDSKAGPPIGVCNGYRLPRRGSTYDQANKDGYSRIDDGDETTFWKSNPYLARPYASEDHPQWLVVILDRARPVDSLRILWGALYPRRYQVEYWDDPDNPDASGIDNTYSHSGVWRSFPKGVVTGAAGGDVRLMLAGHPISCRFVRIRMEDSAGGSGVAGDPRDRLGFSVRELSVGCANRDGKFQDWVRHARDSARQTVIYASSTDPWHRGVDRDQNVEQPGFDTIYRSGLTRGLPVMVPVGLAYDTPENSVAEIRWLRARGYKISRVEMGEEPDGQYMTPEDYGALYVQWAAALHREDPSLILGGPCFQTVSEEVPAWPDAGAPSRSWTRRFLTYLRAHGAARELGFFSVECYPYDAMCVPPAPQLAALPKLLSDAMERWRRAGIPTDIPWFITEYGYSAYAGQPEVDLPGALLNAELVAYFVTHGGAGAYFYGCEPNTLIKELDQCNTWGNLSLFQSDDDRHIQSPFAAYYGAKLLTQEWSQPGAKSLELYPAICTVAGSRAPSPVTAYAARRPDGRWSLLLLNKDPKRSYRVQVGFQSSQRLSGPVTLLQYGPSQYRWHPADDHGYASPNRPPLRTIISANTGVTLPPYSLTVERGIVR
ncbi:hypothetical protein CCAX7_20370 [Capsulimonas corticalis]|uniref:Uncharacterized protein n=1 Tax=Capsulimonas corticalis TaxID=2219043 RepID=A0A402D2D2_9BACT|nr:discoidin domain-containing protein [Capsulimonas corticalis]BDI29986.1 hypothetical protein CCAX7_20370 [Capsulimonas corticalis]